MYASLFSIANADAQMHVCFRYSPQQMPCSQMQLTICVLNCKFGHASAGLRHNFRFSVLNRKCGRANACIFFYSPLQMPCSQMHLTFCVLDCKCGRASAGLRHNFRTQMRTRKCKYASLFPNANADAQMQVCFSIPERKCGRANECMLFFTQSQMRTRKCMRLPLFSTANADAQMQVCFPVPKCRCGGANASMLLYSKQMRTRKCL